MTYLIEVEYVCDDGTIKLFTRRCASKPYVQPFRRPNGRTAANVGERLADGVTSAWVRYFNRIDWYGFEEEITDE